jgi:hypothetical protein
MDQVTDDAEPHRAIARLEERIEQLSLKLEGCRKFALAAQCAMALGAVILAGLLFRVIPFDPLAMTSSIVALLGGIVMSGSNKSTASETAAAWAEAEAERAELIGAIDLQLVRERPLLH